MVTSHLPMNEIHDPTFKLKWRIIMACNCDHMEPTRSEIKLSRLACVLDELNGLHVRQSYWNGYHPKVYSQTYDRYASDLNAEKLSQEVIEEVEKREDMSDLSLECQMWIRDYKRSLMKRQTKIDKEKKEKLAKDAALSKLTPAERKALGY